ncbi:MAG: hypothetical protein WCY09_09025, partial [Candidatus Omnitrophota bacterium]
MKRILIFILILIPMLSWAFGTKPVTTTVTFPDSMKIYTNDTLVVTGTVTAEIDSADMRKTISIDAIPDPDSSKTRKMISIDVLPAITGAVTTSGTATVTGSTSTTNFDDMQPVMRNIVAGDSAVVNLDTLIITQSVLFGNTTGVTFRIGVKVSTTTGDSNKVSAQFFCGDSAYSRIFPLYAFNDTDYAVPTIVTADDITLTAGRIRWFLPYSPT